jgi:hypothetical protein
MGFAISWAAVSGIDRAAVLERLALADSGDLDEYRETPASAATLNEWTVIWSNDFEYFRDRTRLASLSREARVIAFCVEEHVMYFAAEEWRDGKSMWHVTHDAQEDNNHIAIEGVAPPGHLDLLASMRLKQEAEADVDHICELPTVLAQNITGFRYDGNTDHVFTALVHLGGAKAPKKKGWFGR